MTPVFAHGHLRLYLLSILAEQPMHGYELIQALGNQFGGTYVPSAGTIYPRLGKLEEDGLVTKSTDGRKTVYEITDAGRAELAARSGELDEIESDVTDSVRRLADEVRASVNDAMKTLRADLASAARDARVSGSPTTGRTTGPTSGPATGPTTGQASTDDWSISSARLRDAELVVNDFRHQMRADLRVLAAKGQLPEGTVDLLRSQLDAVRESLKSLRF